MGSNSDTKRKGELLERLVALLHQTPGLKVERNYHYPVDEEDESATREIDVLVTAKRGGTDVEFAIECKNLKSKVGVELIDAFVGKLKDIGLKTVQGIYVAVNGYTKPAIRRAVKEGIRPLVLRGLTQDRLESAVEDAFRYVVYFMPELSTIQSFDDSQGARNLLDMLSYSTGEVGAKEIIINNAWQKWYSGKVPREIGCHVFQIKLPSAEPDVEGAVKTFYPQINVLGLVVETGAKFRHHRLDDAASGDPVRVRTAMSVENGAKSRLRFFGSSRSLRDFLNTRKSTKLVIGTIPLPRLQFRDFFWPLSGAAVERARDLVNRGQGLSFEAVEGLDMSAAWADFLTGDFTAQDYAQALASYEIESAQFPSVPIHHSIWVERQTEM